MDAKMIGTIIVLVLLLAIILAIYIAVYRIREKIRSFSRMAWGTDSLSKGVEKMKLEYASTPKSVSAMTSLYLPKITKDFPEFKYDEMKQRAENVLTYYLMGIDRENASLLKDGNRQLKDKLQAEIAMRKSAGQREHFRSIDIHRTEISSYQKKQGRCIITFQSAVQYFHGISQRDSGKSENIDKLPTQSKYDIDLIYVQDESVVEDERDYGLGLNCPNCGAPISMLGAKVCEYCGTPVVELNLHVWSFSDVREVK